MDWFNMVGLIALASLWGKNEDGTYSEFPSYIHYTEEQKKKIVQRAEQIENNEIKIRIFKIIENDGLSDKNCFVISIALSILDNSKNQEGEI